MQDGPDKLSGTRILKSDTRDCCVPLKYIWWFRETSCDKLRREMVKGKGFNNVVDRPHIIVADAGRGVNKGRINTKS